MDTIKLAESEELCTRLVHTSCFSPRNTNATVVNVGGRVSCYFLVSL